MQSPTLTEAEEHDLKAVVQVGAPRGITSGDIIAFIILTNISD